MTSTPTQLLYLVRPSATKTTADHPYHPHLQCTSRCLLNTASPSVTAHVSALETMFAEIWLMAFLAGTLLVTISGSLTNCSDVDCGVGMHDRNARLFSIGSRPLLGWNPYDGFDWCFRESDLLSAVDAMESTLKPVGYNLMMVEYYWYLDLNSETMYLDQHARPQPDPNRFPSAIGEQGFKQLSAYLHSKGLLFGLHTMRGINHMAVQQKLGVLGTNYTADQIVDLTKPCPWVGGSTTAPYALFYSVNMSHPGGQTFYNSLYAQYAEWGVDVIKNDCVWLDYVPDQIEATSKAIAASGRPMLYSLSPGMDDPQATKLVLPMVNFWRQNDDTWDDWPRIVNHFASSARQQPFIGSHGRYGLPGFPDLDILPLGFIGDEGQCHGPSRQSKLTEQEQITVMTLWIIVRSPLQVSGDLSRFSGFLMSLLTNEDALAISANSTNTNFLFSNSSMAVWRSDDVLWSQTGVSYTSIHNLLDYSTNISIPVTDVRGSQGGKVCEVFDVWGGTVQKQLSTISATLDGHGSALYKLSRCTSERLSVRVLLA